MNYLVSYFCAGRTWYISMMKNLNVKMSCTMDHHAMISDNHSKFDNMKAWVKTQKNYFSSCNLLLLHRELKDHIVSAYFQSSERLKNVNKSLPEYIRSDNFGLENIIKHILLEQ